MPLIIGIAGQKRAGKDSVAAALSYGAEREHGEGFVWMRESFAAPLRKFVAELLGWNLSQLEEFKEVPNADFGGATARHMLQTLGTEWGRHMVDGNIWLTAARNRIQRSVDGGESPHLVLFTDVRFDNEAQMIRDMGGVVLYIKRPATDKAEAEHASEAGISAALVDVWHANVGTLEDLRTNVIDRGLPLLRLAAQERYQQMHQGDVYE